MYVLVFLKVYNVLKLSWENVKMWKNLNLIKVLIYLWLFHLFFHTKHHFLVKSTMTFSWDRIFQDSIRNIDYSILNLKKNTTLTWGLKNEVLKSIHFKKTVAKSSFLSKVLSFSLKSKQIFILKMTTLLKETRFV